MQEPNFKWLLGSKAKDKLSGYTGVIVSRTQHINGCNRYVIEAPKDKDGKLPEAYSFDEERIQVLPGKDFVEMANKARGEKAPLPGGPRTRVPRSQL